MRGTRRLEDYMEDEASPVTVTLDVSNNDLIVTICALATGL
jgi:hypothetical protein